MAEGGPQIGISVDLIAERAPGQYGQLPLVAVGEGDDDSVGSQVGEPGDRIGNEAGLGLLAVGDHRRPGLFEAPDSVADRLVLRGGELGVADLASSVTGHRG